MKKVKTFLGLLTLVAVLGLSSPTIAQTTDGTTTQTSTNSDDENGYWGLLGLLGLAGLLGLRRRDRDHDRVTR